MTTLIEAQDEEESSDTFLFLEKVDTLHKKLLNDLDYQKLRSLEEDGEEYVGYIRKAAEQALEKLKLYETEEEKNNLREAVIDELTGFGPLEPLLRDERVTDIFVNSFDTIFVEKKGRVGKSGIRFLNDEHIYRLVQRVASKAGRHLDLGTPYLDAQLPDGSRLHAIIPPVAINGVKVSIRKFSFNKLVIDTLVEGGSMTPKMCKLLQIAVKSRFNIVICGGTGSGKTTMLNCLLDSIRQGERVITIEDTPELEPSHSHTVRLVTRAANAEGKGGVDQGALMINALRMRPDRVILGELRGSEAFNLLHAMNTGQDGSMVTLHASGAEEAIARLLNMILMAKYSLSVESVRQQIAGALDLVIHVSRLVDGSRRVMSISQIARDKDGDVLVQDLFRYRIDKISEEELEGEFEQFNPKLPLRFENKLMCAGLLKSFKELLEGIDPPEEGR